MQGFKGLLPRQVLSDEAFLPIYKKAEDHRKAAQMCIDFFQQINKFFQSFSVAVQKCVQDTDIQNIKASYYCLIGFVCTKLLIENKNLTDNTKGSSKELTKLCNVILQDFSKYLQVFQGNLRKYQESQIIVQQLSKKYFRSHKNMLSSIQAYKASLTDVTLIYNIDQQIKRYQTCENYYKTVASQFQAICEKSQALSEKKARIVKNYEDFKSQFTKVIKMIGSRVISQTKNFVNYYCNTNKSIATFLAEQKYNLQKQHLTTFFSDVQDPSNLQYFNLEQIPQRPQRSGKNNIPLLFLYPQFIKDEHIESYNSEMLTYLKKIQQNVQNRKSENKRIMQLFYQYFKTIQKVHIIGVKQIIQNFEKLKKRLVESFGPRLPSFMKSINAIFQLLSGINQKLIKNTNVKLTSIQLLINQQAKLLKLFNDELKTNIQRFIGKKQLKKLRQQQFTQQSTVINIQSFRKQMNQRALFLKHLIQGFQQKMKKNCVAMSQTYTNLVHDLNQSINQFYSLCCQYQQLYFGPEEFKKNFQIYQTDVDNLIQKNKAYFEELVLNVLKGDNTKITFDGEFSKVEDFKKLKKPTPTEVLSQKQPQNNENKPQKQPQEQKSPKQLKQSNEQNKMRDSSPAPQRKSEQIQKANSMQFIQKVSRKHSVKQLPPPTPPTDEKQLKNFEFILSKTQFKQNQQYIKSFACALSQKIVLQGRIYITTHRICFSSGFNSNNLFFGGTFIQFPKQHILKVEKRINTLFMDNSISFTTVKGELSFTSFFSRNQAYDLVCKTFDLSLDQHVYQYTEVQQKPPQIVLQVKQEDDLNDNQIQGRKSGIESLLSKFTYNQFLKSEIAKQGLNAYQIFKIFYINNQITMNRRKFPSFLLYIRQILGHKEIQIDPWNPPLQQIMNSSNIKTNSALKIERKVRAVVPVANSGVPFMPKTAKSQQIQSVYIYSKHKWILETQVSTTGAPYTDTFKVQIRTTVTSDQSGKCEIVTGLFINFVKNTMMKSVIQSKSQEQSMKASKTWVDEMKKYFNALLKSESTSKKGQNPVQQIKQELQAKNSEIEALSKQKQQLKKQIQTLKLQKQKTKKIIMGLIALIIILFLLAIK